MGWTNEKPTEQGLYWYWESEISHPYIVEIGDQFKVITTYSVTDLESYGGYWLGPLETQGKSATINGRNNGDCLCGASQTHRQEMTKNLYRKPAWNKARKPLWNYFRNILRQFL